ncbi:MAG: PP2C family protein-serine/threonine phosphatase [Gemmatimonadota bacterium]
MQALGALVRGRARLWHLRAGRSRLLAGDPPSEPPELPPPPGGQNGRWCAPVPGLDGVWLEVETTAGDAGRDGPLILAAVTALLRARQETALITEELAGRYEEIDLLYAIGEILGQTVNLREAGETILREVSAVVGARRASIMVYDEAQHLLRVVAARGVDAAEIGPVAVDDPDSVAAEVFRDRRIRAAEEPGDGRGDGDDPRRYAGRAYLSVPICYTAAGENRCVGVINLTDRIAGDSFTPGEIKLVSAVANQIGVAIQNARLVERDLARQRLQQELALAHDLQLRLLPSPAVLQHDAHVAARCLPAEQVGGDFYTFTRLGRGRVGVMLGDVSSHGFSAALIMAAVLSAAGIHVGASFTPDETLELMLQSLQRELDGTDMYLSIFYGVIDPNAGTLAYANAGHPYAFRIPRFGPPERLESTAPPLGLGASGSIQRRLVPWSVPTDLLCLWTDGLADARNGEGEPFGEQRILDAIVARRYESPEAIVEAVLAAASAFGAIPTDDRTLLVLRT